MNDIFLPHICDVYKPTITTRDLQEVQEMTRIAKCVKCKVVEQKAKWINGQYVMERSDETSIVFLSCQDIEKWYKIVIWDRSYTVSDIQPRNFASWYDAWKRTTCKLL